jgi:hypothetical protein
VRPPRMLTLRHGSRPAPEAVKRAPRWKLTVSTVKRIVAAQPHDWLSVAVSTMTGMSPPDVEGPAWALLRAVVRSRLPGLCTPPPAGRGVCACCQGPARPGSARCFQCELHAAAAPGLLADVVAAAGYAPKGSPLARDLWLYKSGAPAAPAAGRALLALLLTFLHDHGPQIWRRGRMPAPSHACVVPSSRGRAGPHPLRALLSGYLTLPWAVLRPCAAGGSWGRDLDPGRFQADGPLTGASVLVLDDTWTSGASAQSAVLACRRAGARWVAVVVIGRHLPAASEPIGCAGEPERTGRRVPDRPGPACPPHQP